MVAKGSHPQVAEGVPVWRCRQASSLWGGTQRWGMRRATEEILVTEGARPSGPVSLPVLLTCAATQGSHTDQLVRLHGTQEIMYKIAASVWIGRKCGE